jgi:L-threonylcarbamoyladenylate synthase
MGHVPQYHRDNQKQCANLRCAFTFKGKMPHRNCEIVAVESRFPEQPAIGLAAAAIRKGGLVVFPTNTFYGLGVRAFHADSVEKVFRAKKRNPTKPLLILISNITDLPSLVESVPAKAESIIEKFWPGNVTVVFQAKENLPANLTGHTGKIGIRLAGHPVASALVKEVGSPITGTSANISGKAGAMSVQELDREMLTHVDLVLDAGVLGGGRGSTVVDVTVRPTRIVREGNVSADSILSVSKG